MIRWKLNELMARHHIRGKAFAACLGVREATVTNLRQATSMPRVDSDRVDQILKGLNELADPDTLHKKIELADLIEEAD